MLTIHDPWCEQPSFPEAMAAGCACISFDCEAGPADLIDDERNGFLIKEMDHQDYKKKLKRLLEDEALREQFSLKAIEKVKQYSTDLIASRYLEFMTT